MNLKAVSVQVPCVHSGFLIATDLNYLLYEGVHYLTGLYGIQKGRGNPIISPDTQCLDSSLFMRKVSGHKCNHQTDRYHTVYSRNVSDNRVEATCVPRVMLEVL